MTKTKILIAGTGGVGGYFGGLLAKEYRENDDIEIYFLSRGENQQGTIWGTGNFIKLRRSAWSNYSKTPVLR